MVAWALGWGTGLDARLGKGAVFLGVGGGPRAQVELGERLDVTAEARWLTLAGSSWMARAGVGMHLERGAWQPAAGVDAAVFWGASLRAVTQDNPDLVADWAPALQLRLEPMRFATERVQAGALRLQVGSGWDRGRPALSVGVTLVDVAVRL